MMAQLLVVSEQQRRAVDLREHNVEVAVAVDVGESGAAADHRLEDVVAAVFRGDSREARIFVDSARVPEQLRGLAIALALRDLFDLLFDVTVGRQQIEPAIQVVVEEKHAEGQ